MKVLSIWIPLLIAEAGLVVGADHHPVLGAQILALGSHQGLHNGVLIRKGVIEDSIVALVFRGPFLVVNRSEKIL